MKSFVFSSTKSIISEIGVISTIAELCHSLNILRPLIVTDQGIIDNDLIAPVINAFNNAQMQYWCFDKVVADPPEAIVVEAVKYAKQSKIDGVIGLGGGSSLDTAKLVALLANSDESIADIYGIDNIKAKRFPLILIPTTAGTGSEVTPISIVTTGATTKTGVVSAELLPDIALLDASLTISLPPHITAATGIDAMVHAIEAFTSAIKKNPLSDMLAKSALELLSKNIVEATFNGENLEVRQAMLLGSCLAGQAFANAPVGAVHAMAYPLGGQFHIAHGLSNALVLPHVMTFNKSHCADLYAELATHIMPDSGNDNDNDGNSSLQTAEHLIHFLHELIAKLQLPQSLAELGIQEKHIDPLANDALAQTRLLINNPKTVSLEDAKQIYLNALTGKRNG
ncbi:iron-containing alcohol dehydrogenase [Brumicola pallidula]|jgi:alcohol dehydrogenase|uniref:Probable alcohol dehydrogenase n=1 Tax=Brumicola pallidula DSM 14239 = ACAM 615 TaxID=1121922 RepID=K7A434_9ALTE|nr:iron-containing alcohol dehydrogenase [Glaciecola pallidula]GAC30245.1 probable alcohol dehydrogenase [Glaciecola pallidula DSM 14239 = ACAM 615]